jgi:hypothetical protein
LLPCAISLLVTFAVGLVLLPMSVGQQSILDIAAQVPFAANLAWVGASLLVLLVASIALWLVRTAVGGLGEQSARHAFALFTLPAGVVLTQTGWFHARISDALRLALPGTDTNHLVIEGLVLGALGWVILVIWFAVAVGRLRR